MLLKLLVIDKKSEKIRILALKVEVLPDKKVIFVYC